MRLFEVLWNKLLMALRLWAGDDDARRENGEDTAAYVPASPGEEELPVPVFAAEVASINKRRQSLGLDRIEGARLKPGPRLGLAGLAISGGGIRSATFNLGVLQALERRGLLPRMDYLSTVSGGGYIGGCLSSVFASATTGAPDVTRLSGLPAASSLAGGVMEDDGRWRVDASNVAQLELSLPCVPRTYSFTLNAVADRPGGPPVRAWARGPLPNGVRCRDGAAGLIVEVSAAAAQQGVVIPLCIRVDAFPFRHRVGVPESPAFRHLRDYSNYLTPRKFLAGLRLPALFLRGLLVNFMILLPLVLGLTLATLWIDGGDLRETLLTEQRTVPLRADAPWLEPAGVEGNRYNLRLDLVLAGPAPLDQSFDYVAVQGFGRDVWPTTGPAPERGMLVVPSSQTLLPMTLAPAGAGTPALTIHAWKAAAGTDAVGANGATDMDPVTRTRTEVFTAIGWCALGALALLALYPMVQGMAEHLLGRSWKSRDWLTRYFAGGVLLATAVLALALVQPLAINGLHEMGKVNLFGLADAADFSTMGAALLVGIGILFSGPLAARASGLAGKAGLTVLATAGPLVVWLFYLNLCRWALVPESAPEWLLGVAQFLGSGDGPLGFLAEGTALIGTWLGSVFAPLHDGWQWQGATGDLVLAYGGVGLAAFVITRLFYDVNATSFNRFYRDRLSRAYMLNAWPDNNDGPGRAGVCHNDAQKLSDLDESLSSYHLINTTLNVQTSRKGNLRGRNGAFFVMSRNYMGGPLTGYRATSEMEDRQAEVDLATAVAISGAAAAPNMGAETRRALTFVLTLLNIRLGHWLPHPRVFTAPVYRVPVLGRVLKAVVSPFMRVTPIYLLREMLGQLDETGRHINLTDGGHLENLGVYELLRRRCRLIIACDGEADPDTSFKGLANAIRLARIDLGVNVEIDVDALRVRDGDDWSRAHGAVGRIHYGGGEYGYLIYIKSSMTGDEPVSIRKYRDDDPSFPHQTTADQFFDEAQFEAYRALGYHAGEAVLDQMLDRAAAGIVTDLDRLIADLPAEFGKAQRKNS